MPVEYVGRPITRLEDPKLVIGADPYVNDVRLDGALIMAVVRSPYAHARLVRVDTRAARAITGVVGAWSAAELQDGVGIIHSPVPDQAFDRLHRRGHTLLAEDRVRYVGQPVAVVIAESVQTAADGVEAVEVDSEPLPAVVESEAALAAGAPLLHPELGTNLALSLTREQGGRGGRLQRRGSDPRAELVNQRLIPLAMEPRACSAVWDAATGRLTVWGDTQAPHRMRDQIAGRLKLPPDRVHLLTARVGGGFGPLLAMRLNRPVRWAATRREDMQATGRGRDMRCRLRLAADGDGRIRAFDARIVGNVGVCLYRRPAQVRLRRRQRAHSEPAAGPGTGARRSRSGHRAGAVGRGTNAVMDALAAPFGVASLDPPLTAAKLWAAMHGDGRRRSPRARVTA